jgi:hypothetical protein
MLSSPELPHSFRPPTCGETLRTIALGEHTVSYVLRRARRRTIGLSIDHRGLRVGAPQRRLAARRRSHRSCSMANGSEANSTNGHARPHPEPLRSSMACRYRCSATRSPSAWPSAPIAASGTRKRPNAHSPCVCAHPQKHRCCSRRRCASGPARCSSSAWAITLPGSASPCRAFRPVIGAHPLGKLQPAQRHSPELAADPLPAAGDRLRRGARTGAPARNEPQCALLVDRRAGVPRLPERAQSPAAWRDPLPSLVRKTDADSAYDVACWRS